MKKRWFIGLGIMLLFVFGLAGCGNNSDSQDGDTEGQQKTYTIRLGTIQAPDNVITMAAQKFADYAKEKSGGRLNVTVLPASQLGAAKEQLESVKLGGQEMFIDDSVWLGPYVPEYNIMGLAFTYRDANHLKNFLGGAEGQEIAEKVRSSHGVRVLSQTFERVPRNLLTTKSVKSLADLSGLKLRVPENPAYVEVWKAIGAAPTPMAMGELYTAMEQGVVEGLEVNTDSMYSQKFHEVAKFFVPTKHVLATCALVINEKFYQELPEDLQKVIDEATLEAEKYNNETVAQLDSQCLEEMKEAGVIVNEVDIEAFKQAAKDVPQSLEKKGIWPEGLFDRIQAIQ